MFTIENILSTKKKPESSRRRDEETRVADPAASPPVFGHTTGVITSIPKSVIARPIPRRIETNYSPDQVSLQYPRVGTLLNEYPNTSFSKDAREDADSGRPQSSPLDLHTSSSVRGDPGDELPIKTERFGVIRRRSISSRSDNSESQSSYDIPHMSSIHVPKVCYDDSIAPTYYFGPSSNQTTIAQSNVTTAQLEARTSARTLVDTTNETQLPGSSSRQEINNILYQGSSSHHTTTQFHAPRMSVMPLIPREAPIPQVNYPSMFRHMPPLQDVPFNPYMLRHLMEGRQNRVGPFHLRDPGPLYGFPQRAGRHSTRRGGQVRFTGEQTRHLETIFAGQKYINPAQRKQLAEKLGLQEKQVKTWFQNRRAKWRKLSAPGGEEEREEEPPTAGSRRTSRDTPGSNSGALEGDVDPGMEEERSATEQELLTSVEDVSDGGVTPAVSCSPAGSVTPH